MRSGQWVLFPSKNKFPPISNWYDTDKYKIIIQVLHVSTYRKGRTYN